MKYYGAIGYFDTVENENRPGIWEEKIIERTHYGDVIRKTYRLPYGEGINTDFQINNQISIVMDPFASQNFHKIRYVVWKDTKFEVTHVEFQPPRLILDIGGVYNGEHGPQD